MTPAITEYVCASQRQLRYDPRVPHRWRMLSPGLYRHKLICHDCGTTTVTRADSRNGPPFVGLPFFVAPATVVGGRP